MNTNVITDVAQAEMHDTKYKSEHPGPVGGLGTGFPALSCSAFTIYSPVLVMVGWKTPSLKLFWRWANAAQHGCPHPSLCLCGAAEWSCHQTAAPSHQGNRNNKYGPSETGNLAQRGWESTTTTKLSPHALERNSWEASPGSVKRRARERGNQRPKCFLSSKHSAPRPNYTGSTILTKTTGSLSLCMSIQPTSKLWL